MTESVNAEDKKERKKKIAINDKYALCIDKYCMWLEELRPSKVKGKGKTDEEEEGLGWFRCSGYYADIEPLMISFAKAKLRDIEASEVKEYLSKMNETEEEIKSLIKDMLKAIKVKRS